MITQRFRPYFSGQGVQVEELCKSLVDTTPEWIIEKTGIKRRYLAEESDSASGLGVASARDAIRMAGIKPDINV